MKLSGFTFLKNASKLYYPVKESILSILDIVDEFVIAVGDCSPDDNTMDILESIGSEKIKIVHTVWDTDKYPGGTEYAHQTDIAKEACTGDWLFYLQGDEVIHEEDHANILEACNKYLNKDEIEGFIFKYRHFYGDYEHYFNNHCWYPYEIRIIRNHPDIHSYRDAQSFRVMPEFDGISYANKENTRKLNVVEINARIFHYGWVRPPQTMLNKSKNMASHYLSKEATKKKHNTYIGDYFDYGRMDRIPTFKETHPSIMANKIKELDWKDKLRTSGPVAINRKLAKHERLKYRVIIFIEQTFLGGRLIGGYKNYNRIGKA